MVDVWHLVPNLNQELVESRCESSYEDVLLENLDQLKSPRLVGLTKTLQLEVGTILGRVV